VDSRGIAAAIQDALDAGLNVQALDVARSATAGAGASDPQVLYLGALACARMGAVDEAEAWLARIDRAPLGANVLGVDVWSLAGRIAKERFAAARERGSAEAPALARVAMDAYERAFALSRDPYPAVNAATLAMLAGDAPRAAALAREAQRALGEPTDHWQHASLGEALLLLGRDDDARAHYAEAQRLAGQRFGDIASMRRQLRLIGSDAALQLLDVLPAPRVIAFSGHMIDRPGRTAPRFPPALEPEVANALRATIARLGPVVGYAQAACGGDILFLEAMQDAGWQTQVVLPFATESFIETSVRFAGARWVERFHGVLAHATRVLVATEEPFLGDDVLFEHAANLIQGLAFLRARELTSDALLLTVRDGDATARVGGSTSTANLWSQSGAAVLNVDLAALRRAKPEGAVVRVDDAARSAYDADRQRGAAVEPTAVEPGASESTATTSVERRRSLKSLLFADISGFSRMPEQYTPDFAEMFLGNCKRILDALAHPAVAARTEGDGLFLVFEQPSHAADFALRLQATLSGVDWRTLGLAAETGARVGLHTGPLFRIFDPVTDQFTFYGAHVNRTARLEPIVQPGQIFVTEEFAASLVAENDLRFQCDYVGVMQLAKQYGTARLFRLRGGAA
jgi:class 3 adenylate cyclase/tetratricopeptide (TPR) repeat protein